MCMQRTWTIYTRHISGTITSAQGTRTGLWTWRHDILSKAYLLKRMNHWLETSDLWSAHLSHISTHFKKRKKKIIASSFSSIWVSVGQRTLLIVCIQFSREFFLISRKENGLIQLISTHVELTSWVHVTASVSYETYLYLPTKSWTLVTSNLFVPVVLDRATCLLQAEKHFRKTI